MQFPKKIIPLSLLAVCFGYIEAMVVVYLRRTVPLSMWEQATSYRQLIALLNTTGIMWSEQTREFSTIVILVCLAFLFGEDRRQRWGAFLIAFGLWDIFYYVFLFIWLRWPESLMTWDVLFLIPAPWIAPVIVPVVISAGMIGTGLFLVRNHKDERR